MAIKMLNSGFKKNEIQRISSSFENYAENSKKREVQRVYGSLETGMSLETVFKILGHLNDDYCLGGKHCLSDGSDSDLVVEMVTHSGKLEYLNCIYSPYLEYEGDPWPELDIHRKIFTFPLSWEYNSGLHQSCYFYNFDKEIEDIGLVMEPLKETSRASITLTFDNDKLVDKSQKGLIEGITIK